MSTGELQKRSLRLAGHRTSLALEAEFWVVVEELAHWKGQTIPVLIARIDADRAEITPNASLASAVRVTALRFLAGGLSSTMQNILARKLAA